MQIEKTKQTTNTTESSVLFSLASLGAMAKPAPVAVEPAAKIEDLLGIGATPSPVLAPPVLAPVIAKAPPAQSTRVWIACATIVAAGILGGSYAAARAMQPAPRVVTQVSAVPIESEVEVVGAVEVERAAEVEREVEVEVEREPEIARTAEHPRPHPHVDPVVVATPVVTEHAHEPQTLEQLVEQAVHPTEDHVRPPPAATAATTLPATPTRADVIAAMTGVTPNVSACGPEHGIATVQITVSHTGRVANAVVSGPFAGTPTGSCVARAVRAARFPEFSRDTFALSYPFRL